MDDAVLNSLLMMMIAVGFLGAILFFLKKVSKKMNDKKGSSAIKIITKLPITSKSSIMLIEVKNQEFLISVTDNSINLLSDFENGAIEDIKDVVSSNIDSTEKETQKDEDSPHLSFSSFLKSNFKKN